MLSFLFCYFKGRKPVRRIWVNRRLWVGSRELTNHVIENPLASDPFLDAPIDGIAFALENESSHLI